MPTTYKYFRLKAFVMHLAISLIIALISLYVVFYIWHPSPLAKAIGVTSIFIMMLAIDTVLGPLLTLIVAKPNKPSLKFDLSIIIILQFSAYLYGMYNISVNRPVFIAFDNIRFDLVQASDVPRISLKDAKKAYNDLSYTGPKWIAVILPKNDEERTQRLFNELQSGIAPSMQPNLYEPLHNQWNTIEKRSKPLANLYKFNQKSNVKDIIDNYPEATVWLPLKAYEQDMVVLIDEQHNKIVEIVDLRPWE